MIFGMPAQSFFAFLSWPAIFIVSAFIVFFIMRKQDAQIDDSEFEQSMKGRGGADK